MTDLTTAHPTRQHLAELVVRLRNGEPISTDDGRLIAAHLEHHLAALNLIAGSVSEDRPIALPTDGRHLRPEPDWTTLDRAAAHGKVHRDTMVERARRHGIGIKVGGVWKIDLNRLHAFENGLPFEPLRSE